ncbi:MAG TPA: DUF2442 domain-containing protein [Mucilaginibacter sp.]|jgi:hypothetical protein|nr:DUF2442 domain-containing protein [Mucilaginibacter sp.]
MKVISVKPKLGYKIEVAFDDGVSGIVDLKEFVATGIFSKLKDEQLFKKVYTTGYSVAWCDELEIDALTIYAEASGKAPEDILSQNLSHASN